MQTSLMAFCKYRHHLKWLKRELQRIDCNSYLYDIIEVLFHKSIVFHISIMNLRANRHVDLKWQDYKKIFEKQLHLWKHRTGNKSLYKVKITEENWRIGCSWYAWSGRVKGSLTAVVLACIGSSSLAALLLFEEVTDVLRCHHLNKEGEEKKMNSRHYKLTFN